MKAHPKIVLYRRAQAKGQPTLGSFLWEPYPGVMRHMMIRSIELPWKNNDKGTSCIPEGLYELRFTLSKRFGKKMWEVMNVPGRGGIRIHAGNYLKDTEGCILPCLKWTDINKDGVLDGASSGDALQMLEEGLEAYQDKGLMIEIRSASVKV